MSKESEKLVSDLNKMEKTRTVESIKNFPLVQIIKGMWLFSEGSALMIVSLFAIYEAHYHEKQHATQYVLTVAGVLVLVPAAALLSKFFRNVGKA